MPRNRKPGHYRVKLGDALSAHNVAITFGGLPGIHDIGMVESAIARPYCGYYRPMYLKCAALVESCASNHGFLDGNKRTTLILLNLLLTKSGYRLRMTHKRANSALERIILATVQRKMAFQDLAKWFKGHLTRR